MLRKWHLSAGMVKNKSKLPVDLSFPIFGKLLERFLYSEIFDLFITNHLISSDKPHFKSGDSCIIRLLSITHGIYVSFAEGYEDRGVFLDISKAFDKVWHEGFMFQLKQKWNILQIVRLITEFLSYMNQRVVLNG